MVNSWKQKKNSRGDSKVFEDEESMKTKPMESNERPTMNSETV